MCNYAHHAQHVQNTPTCGEKVEQKRKMCSHSIMVFCEMDQNAPSLKTSTSDLFPIPNNKIKLMGKIFMILHVSFNFI